MEAQTDSMRRTVVGNLKMFYFHLAYIQQTLGVLQRSDSLLTQVQEAAEARYRVGQGNQQDVLKAQLQHTKILQEIAHHHQEEGLLEAQIKQLLGRPQESADIVAEAIPLRALPHDAAEHTSRAGAQEFPSPLQRSVHLRAHRKPGPRLLHGYIRYSAAQSRAPESRIGGSAGEPGASTARAGG